MEQHFAMLGRGESLKHGLASIEHSGSGFLEYCDPYGCGGARLVEHDVVYVDPVPPIHRPQMLSGCIYLEFSEPIVVGEKTTSIWALAPYELVVHVDGTALGYVSPFRVKYTLVGGIVDGTICRYHLTRTALRPEELEPRGLAFIRIDVSGVRGVIPGIGFNAALVKFYLGAGNQVYYPVLIAKREPHHVTARLSDTPPLEGLVEAWRHARKLRLAMTLPAFITPISMG